MENIKNYIIKKTLTNFLVFFALILVGIGFFLLMLYGLATHTIFTGVILGILLLLLVVYVAYTEARDSALEKWLREYDNMERSRKKDE